MSEQKNISPLLDGFTLGNPISEHHGVVCCPAIKENTTKKFIVKIISVPASQVQFDAMLVAGVYKDPGDAMEYFRGNGENILNEAELLKKLSKIEGFLSYDAWQMEPITRRRLGYEIYLVGSYKRTLEKHIRKNPFTHLEAVNLGLDLCAALSVCRQAGYMYVDLKPSNIYVSEKKEYRIGDLGFLSLDSLRYASLPERYFSPYTPPELLDPMASMNLSVDTYAVGMILYQLYNDGVLPFHGTASLESLPTPCHADYEMAEIIMKAIHPDPNQRWTDPKDMGKAIASYMQRNSINDIPITPFIPLDVKPEDIIPVSAGALNAESPDITPDLQAVDEAAEEAANPEDEHESENAESEEIHPPLEMDKSADVITESEPESADASDELEEVPADLRNTEQNEDQISDSVTMPLLPAENNEPQEQEEDSPLADISEEVAQILTKANDIISHEIPEEALYPTEEQLPDPFAFASEENDEIEDNLPMDPLMEDVSADSTSCKKKTTKHFEDPSRKKRIKKFFSSCFALLFVCCACCGGFWYYQNVYLQTLDGMSISGTQNQITVLVDSSIDESLLVLHCTDENGKRRSEPVQGGKATFTNLQPSTQYTIEADMSGFHKLIGNTSGAFTTEATTRILSFQAIAGSEDGSVNLSFTVDGDDPDFWNIYYVADGEEEQRETVTGHSAMISGLTIGKVYTFTLNGGKDFDVSGETTMEYMASRLIMAEDLTATTTDGTNITVHWKTPGDVVVENWNVRYYDGYGFEEQMTVTDNNVLLTGIDPSSHYTVEITAAGMTQPSRIIISADPINVSSFQVDKRTQNDMKISWDHTGNSPEGGWLLMYTVDGSGSQTLECEKTSAVITPLIPGANYEFTLQSADGKTVLNNRMNYLAESAEKFTENAFVPENVSIDLLKTPEEKNWRFESLSDASFTTVFHTGESASIVLRSSSAVYLPSSKTQIMFVFRDVYGNVLPDLVTEISQIWKNIWFAGDIKIGEVDIPKLPTVPGNYTMELYFNGCSVEQFDITIEQ